MTYSRHQVHTRTHSVMLRSEIILLIRNPTGLASISSVSSAATTTTTSCIHENEGEVEESQPQTRPHPLGRIDTSVRLADSDAEGRPSAYLFIFVNPLSGDQKGSDLIHLPIQHFRLRQLPQIQVEIHNILDPEDREAGFDRILMIQSMIKLGQLPDINEGANKRMPERVRHRHMHVWSAGGDGTVMSVFEMLVAHEIDLDLVFFSCIPFGTGNDFSQVLGWGRTITHKDVLGQRLSNLETLILDRLECSDAARLDIWEVEMEAYDSGYVRIAGPDREDGHDVAEVRKNSKEVGQPTALKRKMCNYMSIGVQGYVGSGFEKHRAGNRLANMLVYTRESAKWVFWRRFPPLTRFISSIEHEGETVLHCPSPEGKPRENDNKGIPTMTKHPIDFVIQNIPHIWGREVDLWGEAKSGLESVEGRKGPTDPEAWTPQRANDGKMEIMVINDLYSYFKKLANFRHHVSRLAQIATPFDIVFRAPKEESQRSSSWFDLFRRNHYDRSNIICIMCDGEFYIIKDPKRLKFKRFAQIWTLGRADGDHLARIVRDERANSTDDKKKD